MRGFARTGAAEATANQPYVVVSTRRFPVTYASFAARPWRRQGVTAAALDQSPEPGFAEKYFSNLPSSPSCSLASAGGFFFWLFFAQFWGFSAGAGEPLLQARLGVRLDRIRRAFRFADTAVDAFVRMDHQHVVALVEAIYRADFDAIGVF